MLSYYEERVGRYIDRIQYPLSRDVKREQRRIAKEIKEEQKRIAKEAKRERKRITRDLKQSRGRIVTAPMNSSSKPVVNLRALTVSDCNPHHRNEHYRKIRSSKSVLSKGRSSI